MDILDGPGQGDLQFVAKRFKDTAILTETTFDEHDLDQCDQDKRLSHAIISNSNEKSFRISFQELLTKMPPGYEYHDYACEFISDPYIPNKFWLKHLTGQKPDIEADLVIDQDGEYFEWEGLPLDLLHVISKDYYCTTNYPIGMLNSALNEQLESYRGTRPFEEIHALITESINIKKTKVQDDFDLIEKIGEGSYGSVYSVKRKLDGKIFALKVIKDVQETDMEVIINEASLNAYLMSDELIKCIDLYHNV